MTALSERFPPHALRDYTFLADGERGALLGPRGDIVWMCAPGWDSDAVFASLIGAPGVYAVTPAARFVWGGSYEAGSLIWKSRWVTDEGIIECREALALPAERDRLVLLRRVVAVEGDARVRVDLEARAEFGSKPLTKVALQAGIWTAHTGNLAVRWQGGSSAKPSAGRARRSLGMDLTVPAGGQHDLVLEISAAGLPDEPVDADTAWRSSEEHWRREVPELTDCVSRYEARHSYAVLRGLTGSDGGMVAAATTSLPERMEAGRNYDYRYVWIRDQCYAGHAVAAVGGGPLLLAAVRFVTDRLLADRAQLAPAYTAAGGEVPDQRDLDLPGYPGGFDRIGNWVNKQFQLDAFGEALLLYADAARCDALDPEAWRAAEIAADAVAARWTEPDAGIWEIENRLWTHSRLTAAAGLRAICQAAPLARARGDWLALADKIVAATASAATHPDGYWQRAPDDPALDGSLLLAALRGAVPADDPRTVATIEAYQTQLTVDGYAYRFRQGEGHLSDEEGSFTLCGFLMAMALQQQGDRVGARGWWERSRASCGPAMLYSEEYDVIEHQMRGNLPQAFVHALMLETAAALD